MASNNKNYQRRPGTSADHGHKFELDLTVLTYVRCLKLHAEGKLKSFMIANNMNHVGDFDDVVCRIEYEENGSLQRKLIFVQAKHKQNPYKDATSQAKNKQQTKGTVFVGDKPISKYFTSYLQARKIFSEVDCENFTGEEKSEDESSRCTGNLKQIFNCELKDSLFLFYSNAICDGDSHYEKTHVVEEVTKIFDTSRNNGIFKLKLENMTLSEILSEKYKNLTVDETRRINQFAEQFILYMNQEAESCLEDLIKNEIKSFFKDDSIDTAKLHNLYTYLCDEIKHYFQNDQSQFLTEDNNFVDGAISLQNLQYQTQEFQEKYRHWTKLFRDEFIEELCNIITKHKFLNFVCDSLTRTKMLVQCLQLAKRMQEIKSESNRVLFLYLKKHESVAMWKKVRTLPNYKKFINVFLCLDVGVRSEDVEIFRSFKYGVREMAVALSEDGLVFQRSLLMEFSNMGLKKIMNYDKITFQTVSIHLNDIFGDTLHLELLHNMIDRVLNNERLEFGRRLPDEENIYIQRKYKKCTTLLKYDVINTTNDLFIIYPIKNISKIFELANAENVIAFENEDDAKKFFISRLINNKSTHLCAANNSYLELIHSNKAIENVIDYKIDIEDMDENSFLEHVLSNKCTIISDDVGMGKSTALKRIAHHIKSRNRGYWVEYVELHQKDTNLKTIQGTNQYPVEALLTMLNLDIEDKNILRHKCHTDGSVALLLDGFDEISKEYRPHFLRLLKALSFARINVLVVSTRPNVESEIRKSVLTSQFNIVGFTYGDMYTYLMKYWSQRVETEDAEQLSEVVQNLVDQAEKMKDLLQNIIAVPLQTRMLAEIYVEKIKNILISENVLLSLCLPPLNLYNLYKNFIDMHIDRCMEEKIKITNENKDNYECVRELFFKENSGIWEAFACQELFPATKLRTVNASDLSDLAKQRIGIFLINDQTTITFLHRSFAEFLAARHVSRLLYETHDLLRIRFIYSKICVDETFVVIRRFMNAVYENVSDWETVKIHKKQIPWLVIDDNVLKISILERNVFLFRAIHRHLSKNKSTLKRILNKKYGKESLLHLAYIHCGEVFADVLTSEFFNIANDLKYQHYYSLPIHSACSEGKVDILMSYLSYFLKRESLSSIVNKTDHQKNTPLILAARKGHTNVIRILCKHGASLHNKGPKLRNALMLATSECHIDTVKYLVENDADINEKDKDGNSSFTIAVRNRNIQIVTYLLENGADVNGKDRNGKTALMFAFKNNNIELVKKLIKNGANVNEKDRNGKTAIMFVFKMHNLDIVKYLVEHGANVNEKDAYGNTAFMLAFKRNNENMLRYLFELGADVNAQDCNGNTCLIQCSGQSDETAMLQCLIDVKSKLDHQNIFGDTALIRAASRRKLGNIQLLLKHGASVNICNIKGDAALPSVINDCWFFSKIERGNFCEYSDQEYNFFSENGYDKRNSPLISQEPEIFFKVLKQFIEKGADVNLKNNYGDTSLNNAVAKFDTQITKFLIEHGASSNICNNHGDSALIVAIKSYLDKPSAPASYKLYQQFTDLMNVLEFLLEHRAEINHRNQEGSSALHFAACVDHVEVLKLLVENGANIHLKNNNGETALFRSSSTMKMENLKFLFLRGACSNICNNQGDSVLIVAIKNYADKRHEPNSYKIDKDYFDLIYVMKFLLEHKTVVNHRNQEGNSALHFAACVDHAKVLKLLVEKGADIHLKNNNGETALFCASSKRKMTNLKFLITLGANSNICNDTGDSLLTDTIKKFGNELSAIKQEKMCSELIEIVAYLLEHGAKINHRNDEGNTALHLAASGTSVKLIKMLIKNGADVNLKNNDNKTSKMKAQDNPSNDVREYFKQLHWIALWRTKCNSKLS